MDYTDLLLQYAQQYTYMIPIFTVLVLAILVFVCGFKQAEQPPFSQLSAVSDVDRKLAKKRGKIREKVSKMSSVTFDSSSSVLFSFDNSVYPGTRHDGAPYGSTSVNVFAMHAHIFANQLAERVARKVAVSFPSPQCDVMPQQDIFFLQRGLFSILLLVFS